MVKPPSDLEKFDSFVEIVEALRGPEGCPWDKEQTHRTLTPFAIEEAHELAEAIEAGTKTDVVGELGDLLLQVVLHAEIGRQAAEPSARFDIHDVIRAISEKMVRRHPHVFGDTKVSDANEVLDNWSKLKVEEKAQAKDKKKDLGRFDVPLSLPALQRAHKIGDKTQRLRFDWSSAREVLKKVDEEVAELHEEMKDETDKAALEHEIGDVLFSVAQLARHLGLEAEQCLRTANSRFETRFFAMRKAIEASGREYDSLKPEELEAEWQKVKLQLAQDTK